MTGNTWLAFMFQPEMQQKGKFCANVINISVFEINEVQSEIIDAICCNYLSIQLFLGQNILQQEWGFNINSEDQAFVQAVLLMSIL